MKTLIAIPCLDMMHTEFVRCLVSLRIKGTAEISFGMSSLVYDTRNLFARKAVAGEFDRVLWLDSDMTFQPDLFTRLSEHLDNGRQFVTGLYVTRKKPIKPVIYKAFSAEEGKADCFEDYPKDSVFEIAGAGFGAVMVTTDLINRVGEKFGYPFSPIIGLGEDLSFCQRAREVGATLYCDSSIKLGHVGYKEYTEASFLEGVT